jgi:uncharacterized repeat protein (TIGR01451 family)
MKIIAILSSLIIMMYPAFATTITSSFECDSGNNDSTVTYYAYLNEPKLEESSHTQGYRVKTFDYLYNGKTKLESNFAYFDGEKDESHKEKEELNRSVAYDKSVNFDGIHGISEIIAEGYYPNNRAIAAKKKIRYDDMGYNFSSYSGKAYSMVDLSTQKNRYSIKPSDRYDDNKDKRKIDKYGLGNSTTAEKFSETASVVMGMGEDPNYRLRYETSFKNATFEVHEATGWSNRTGSRRTDWEQEALIKGDVKKVSNVLAARGFRFPGAGENREWLPCCYDATRPTVDELVTGWPTPTVINTMRADSVYPNQTKNCILVNNTTCEKIRICNSTNMKAVAPKPNIAKDCSESGSCKTTTQLSCTQNKYSCVPGSCPGYDCIYSFEEEPSPISSKLPPTAAYNRGKIHVVNLIQKLDEFDEFTPKLLKDNAKNGSVVTYRITVYHTDISPLKNIEVRDVFSTNLIPIESSAKIGGVNSEYPVQADMKTAGSNVTWTFKDELPPNAKLYINIDAQISSNSSDLEQNILENYASATGSLNEVLEKSDVVKAETAE